MNAGALLALPWALVLGTPPAPTNAITPGEFNVLMSQLLRCWSPPVSPRGTNSAAVEIDITVNPDRTVARAAVVDQARYASDPVFRAFAEGALKAIHDPNCSPLALPQDKYDEWKSMTIYFDPKEVSGR